MNLQTQELFHRDWLGYAHCRIPGLCVTPGGAVLAYCEARRDRGSDWDDSDLLLRRSLDGGRTWDAPRVIASYRSYGHGPLNNPVCLADPAAGLTHLLYGHNYARVWACTSADDGATWSVPREITHALQALRPQYDWGVAAVGPGHGVQLVSGRLLAPVWLSSSHTRAHQPSRVAVLYSDDHGQSWQAGDLVPDAVPCCNETTAIALAGGGALLNMRNLGPTHRRAITRSADGAHSWATPWLDGALVEPRCFASMVNYSWPGDERSGIVLFVNPDYLLGPDGQPALSSAARRNLTVRLSRDEGRTWPVARVLDAGPAGYADLAVAPDGAILCLYERGADDDWPRRVTHLTLARFSLAWLEETVCRS